AAVGQKDRRFGHDRRGNHALAPVVDLVIVKSALAEPQQLDHVGAGEAHRIAELAPSALIQRYLHERHVLVAISGCWKAETGDALDYCLGLDALPVRPADNLHNCPRNLTTADCGGEKAERLQAFLYPHQVKGMLLNNNRQQWSAGWFAGKTRFLQVADEFTMNKTLK